MLLSDADTTLILETVRDAARREIMPRFRALSEADINTKSAPDDLVTAADLAAEALITAQLGRAFPDALILGEEAVAANPSLRDQLADAERWQLSLIRSTVRGITPAVWRCLG